MFMLGWKIYSPLFNKEPYTSDVEELRVGSSLKIETPSSFGAYEAMMKQDVYCSNGISRLIESIKRTGLYSISLVISEMLYKPNYYIILTLAP